MIEGASINVNSLMDGDERAFQGLFVDYYSVLVSFAMKYLDNQEAAEDIVQDVFVKIWETREGLITCPLICTRWSVSEVLIICVRRKFVKMPQGLLLRSWRSPR